jgi:hypothetical protein
MALKFNSPEFGRSKIIKLKVVEFDHFFNCGEFATIKNHSLGTAAVKNIK